MNNDPFNVNSPLLVDIDVETLLNKLKADFEPEIVPNIPNEYATPGNCYVNVELKVKNDGGKIQYGWTIYKSDIICEAERHAVWETPDEDLIDVTPRIDGFKQIMFVPDNEFVYEGEDIDNIRLNITDNQVVDDLIFLSEKIEEIYNFGERLDDYMVRLPPEVKNYIERYSHLKLAILDFIKNGGTPKNVCFCQGGKIYKNCHGKTIRPEIDDVIKELKRTFRKIT